MCLYLFCFSWKISSILAAFLASFLWRMILNAILFYLLHTSECSCVLVYSESSENQSNQVLHYTYGLSPCTASSVFQREVGGRRVCCWIEVIYQLAGRWQHYQFIFCNSNCQKTLKEIDYEWGEFEFSDMTNNLEVKVDHNHLNKSTYHIQANMKCSRSRAREAWVMGT